MSEIVFLKTRAGFRGGLEKYTFFLTRAFAEQGCSVTLLTTGTAPAIEGVRVISLAADTKFTLYQLRRFDSLCKQWLEEHPSPLVFGMERTTSQTHYRAGNGVHAVYLQRRKMIDPFWKRLTFPLNPLHRSLLAMEKRAFESEKLKKLFTNSQMVKEEILAHYNTPPEKIEVVHNGVEWEAWQGDFDSTFHQPRGPYHFLFVGNGYVRKGLPFLLHGLELHKAKEFRLTVVGKDKDPASCIKLADKLGLKDKVVFLGPQNDLRPLYKEADSLIIPSIYDPFANVTVEALAMGLFVVSSRFNGGKEVLKEYAGTVIDELTSPSSVADALQKAFDTPKTPERAHKIRNSIKELDFSIQLDKIVRITLQDIS